MAARITTQGLNHFLDTEVHGSAAVTTWYIGLVGATNTYAAGDTLASHAGWAEFTHYTGDRKEWTEGAATGGVTTNSSGVVFTISGATGSETVNGAFLSSASTGTSGTLLGEGDFTGGAKSVANDDTLSVTITLTLTTA